MWRIVYDLSAQRGPRWASALAGAALTVAPAAHAETPVLDFELKNTADVWRALQGGVAVGDTSLDKLQVVANLQGDAVGLPGFKAHAMVFKTNGETLSQSRTGDIQTASNIEALSVIRLFALWVEQRVGGEGARGAEVRLGLMDLNDTFDSIKTAGLFLNSSHGIGPDLSRSGVNGPSIFPVSAAGVQVRWTPRPDLDLHLAAFDGVAGDPAHPKAFAAVRLDEHDGALLIGQADYRFGESGQASLGVWRYTGRFPNAASQRPGVYGFIDGPVPGMPKARAWVRAGVADGRTQPVSDYLGAGVAWTGLWRARPDDQFGLAVARAGLSAGPRGTAASSRAETAFEATYAIRISKPVTLQPDLQYIRHPGGGPDRRDALAVGLRVLVDLSWSVDR